jgi:hypothetical protein
MMDAGAHMTAKIDAFIAEIRTRPAFVAAAASDSKFSDHLDNIERGLNAVDQKADSDPETIEIFDKIQDVIGRSDLPLKQRLLEVGKLLVQVRDAGRIVH